MHSSDVPAHVLYTVTSSNGLAPTGERPSTHATRALARSAFGVNMRLARRMYSSLVASNGQETRTARKHVFSREYACGRQKVHPLCQANGREPALTRSTIYAAYLRTERNRERDERLNRACSCSYNGLRPWTRVGMAGIAGIFASKLAVSLGICGGIVGVGGIFESGGLRWVARRRLNVLSLVTMLSSPSTSSDHETSVWLWRTIKPLFGSAPLTQPA
jgi:hypothetical protein